MFVVLNGLFFVVVLASALVASFVFVLPPLEEGTSVIQNGLFGDSWVLTFLFIFFSNLILSAFLVVTLPGLAFFVLSCLLLSYRSVFWGSLLAFSPISQFLAALPTIVLEGEAYVIAAVAGTTLGLSWFKPNWVFRGESLSRREALVRAFKECFSLYFWVVLVLFVAAIVETLTIYLL
ncbi:MAG: stage II sporulation protein M [Candidatus Bathyarchaeota archaeon]|nr:stage II sporulation protein M [Candidatus Bathyarchaeota archaeon]